MSHFLTHLFQDLLKESFPKFAYWLFYSEMAVAIVFGLVLMFTAEAIVGGVFIIYAASNWVGACNYARKRTLEKKLTWVPSPFDRAVAIFFNLGISIAGGFLLFILRDNWVIIAAGVALIALSLFNLVTLFSGGWIDFP